MSLRFAHRRLRLALSLLSLLAGWAAHPATAGAQQQEDVLPQLPSEVVRGRVVDDSGKALVATVIVTRGPDRLVQQTTSDSGGRYSLRFEPGTGDYLVYVSATGFRSARRRVQRQGSARELVADFTLARDVATLAAMRVRGQRPERASNNTAPTSVETGASERWADGVSGQLSPTVAGDLGALAGTMPGVTLTPSGPSILGSSAESNLTTLNGMGLAATSIPRAARTETRVTGATFDPTRGGFAGANIDVRLGPGDRFYQRRNGFVTFDAPQLQFTDAIGRSLGAPSGGFRGSLGADGELIRKALTYNVALDVGRTSSEPATLLDASLETLLRAGVSPDSVARLIALAGPLGVPLSGGGAPSLRQRDAITWLGRLDDTRDTLSTRTLTSYAGYTREGALGFGPLAAPTVGGERRERTLGAQAVFATFVGPGRYVLTESKLAASHVRTETTPYNRLPAATVLVRSPGEDERRDVTALALGGSALLATDDARWTIEGANETIWNARGRRHRFKTLLSARADGLHQDGIANRYGSFTFPSIEDFAAGRPSSFSRTVSQPVRAGEVWNAATAFAHQWIPSRFFNVLYGARLEASGFASAPARNPVLEQALGVRTGEAPTRVHLSPRIGFNYIYSRDRENGNGTRQDQIGRFYRTSTGMIRGGIGEFRDLLRPALLADASAATGLAGGTALLSCVGAAVPAVDWELFARDPDAVPTSCADGSGLLAERAPAVTLISPSYDVPRSWRASVDWSSNVGKWLVRLGGLASYDLSQPGTIDANFAGTPRFTLADEGGRPVFVSPGSIDPGSGAASASEARRTSEFGRVGMRTSDLRGYGTQLTLGLSPDVFKLRSRRSFFLSGAYTLQHTKRQYRGFDGANFGDPRTIEWAAGANDARHAFVFTGGISGAKLGTVTLFARAQSGLPFTPIVQGDVDGDGRWGDRAFVPDPAATADTALAGQLRALLAEGSPTARRCLQANLGSVVARHACRGPWTQTLNVQWRPPIPSRWARRVSSNIYLQNVLGGLDQLLHGSSLHGWGSQALPDPALLVPRGFDAAAHRYRYDVNQRFADTRPGRSIARDPFRIVLDFSINLSTNFDVQQLRRALEPVRGADGVWARRTADSIAAFYLSRTSSVHKLLLAESDSLFLTATQIAQLRKADSVYSERVRAVYVPVGDFLGRREGEPGKIELDSVSKAQKAYWKIFWEQPEVAAEVVTPTQRALIPMFQRMLETPMKERENSQWQFGHPVVLDPKGPAQAGAPGNRGLSVTSP